MAILPSPPRFVPAHRALPQWQRELRQAVKTVDELCRLLRLDPGDLPLAEGLPAGFPLLVPRGFVRRMQTGDPRDPLLRQVLPVAAEHDEQSGFVADPVDDRAAEVVPGLLRKYQGRALLITTGACAVHCRYCFRRDFPYQDLPPSEAHWRKAIEHIEADETIHEVLLSGGDPLTLSDRRLASLAARLNDIPHLRRLRVHTRLPVVIPSRVNDDLLGWLCDGRLTPIVVIHANHANELDTEVAEAIGRLNERRTLVLNQAVLLRGINDSTEAQRALCERLLDLRVTPYYLHQLDRVSGAAHFETPQREGERIVAELRARLPGYAVPKYVRETPGASSKLMLA